MSADQLPLLPVPLTEKPYAVNNVSNFLHRIWEKYEQDAIFSIIGGEPSSESFTAHIAIDEARGTPGNETSKNVIRNRIKAQDIPPRCIDTP